MSGLGFSPDLIILGFGSWLFSHLGGYEILRFAQDDPC